MIRLLLIKVANFLSFPSDLLVGKVVEISKNERSKAENITATKNALMGCEPFNYLLLKMDILNP